MKEKKDEWFKMSYISTIIFSHRASRIEQMQIKERRKLGTKEKRVIFISCVKLPFYPTFISTSRGII